ncbi:MAG: hypothetical protein HGA45_05545 [Chloroflexales bacterium]|nr:hypothetical protein [Chloroflexales bacterium]
MGTWLDFLQVALALGVGWLGWVLLSVWRSAGQGSLCGEPRAPRWGVRRLIARRR